jgi:DNA-binding transcriptional ArsR family regulator
LSTDNLDRTLAALADPHRRRVVDLLRDRPRRAGELAAAARISFPAMSRHLKTLRNSGLVEENRDEFDSRVRIYRLRGEPMTALKAWLEATETMWTGQLLALKSHLSKTKR